ncbi:NADPH-dependent FMN reductase [Labilibacter marinus]|uniref:NADPH-dependent FMN reductase n=1 Tax=Labilibacter marinus TaxID=1477105 RepID=UPI0009501E0F|nr:NAD(P)H-dependent oxidoreductase [Labilibacter marinus]
MKKILAFGASNSKQSINKILTEYTAKQVSEASYELLDLNDFEMPIFSVDREEKSGIHSLAVKFKAAIKEADGIIISFAEHNGAYSAAFKNIYDWVSRLGRDVWESKPLFLLATSPGERGAQGVLELAHSRYKHSHKNTIATFSLPSFNQNFSADKGITDEALKSAFNEQLSVFVEALKNN